MRFFSITPSRPGILSGALTLALAAFAPIACGGGGDVTPPPPPPPTGGTTSLTATLGGTQSKVAGSASDEMRVRVMKDGAAVANTAVAWTTNGGQLQSTSSTTNADGIASNTLTTVGTSAGNVTVTAASGGASATFTVTVTAAPVGSIEKVGADPTNNETGAADSIRVRVKDAAGAARAGATVTFAVTAGGGTVSPTSVTTGADGIAAARWTRGGAGLNTVTATSAGQTGSPITFSVTAVAKAASLDYGPDFVVAEQGTTTTALTAIVRDGTGAQVTSTATPTYTSRTTSIATVNATGQVTAVAAGQSVVVASVVIDGTTFTDSLLAIVPIAGGPVVMTDLAKFGLKTDTTFTVTLFANMRTSTEKIASGKVTLTWDPTVIAYQSHAEGANNVAATVNANNAATGSLVLAFASSAGFSGKVELRKITFKASATAAKKGALTITTNEMFAVTGFADLLPKTVSVLAPLFTR